MSLLAGQGHLLEPGQSSDSLVTNISSMGSVDPRQDCDSSCAFLKLGLACYTHSHANKVLPTIIMVLISDSVNFYITQLQNSCRLPFPD